MEKENTLLDIGELLQEANALQVATWPQTDVVAITERTFRYWVKQGLIERRGSRGAGTKYPRVLVNRLLFIRMLQKKGALSLANIRTTIGSVDEETIRRVVMLEEPLDLVSDIDADSVRARMEAGEQIVPLAMDAKGQLKEGYQGRFPRGLTKGSSFLGRHNARSAVDESKREEREVMEQFRRLEERLSSYESTLHNVLRRLMPIAEQSRSESWREVQVGMAQLKDQLDRSVESLEILVDRFEEHRHETLRSIHDLTERFESSVSRNPADPTEGDS